MIAPQPNQIWFHAKSATAPTVVIEAATDQLVRFRMQSMEFVFSVPIAYFVSTYKPVMQESGDVLTTLTAGMQ